MAETKHRGNSRLEEALAVLPQAQANLVQVQSACRAQIAEYQRQSAEAERTNAEAFGRIEALLLEHSRILAEITQILLALPDAICEKIGLKRLRSLRKTMLGLV